jgi:hypothetical protein
VKDGPPLRMELRVLAFPHIFRYYEEKCRSFSVYDRHLIRDSWPMGGFFFRVEISIG